MKSPDFKKYFPEYRSLAKIAINFAENGYSDNFSPSNILVNLAFRHIDSKKGKKVGRIRTALSGRLCMCES